MVSDCSTKEVIHSKDIDLSILYFVVLRLFSVDLHGIIYYPDTKEIIS